MFVLHVTPCRPPFPANIKRGDTADSSIRTIWFITFNGFLQTDILMSLRRTIKLPTRGQKDQSWTHWVSTKQSNLNALHCLFAQQTWSLTRILFRKNVLFRQKSQLSKAYKTKTTMYEKMCTLWLQCRPVHATNINEIICIFEKSSKHQTTVQEWHLRSSWHLTQCSLCSPPPTPTQTGGSGGEKVAPRAWSAHTLRIDRAKARPFVISVDFSVTSQRCAFANLLWEIWKSSKVSNWVMQHRQNTSRTKAQIVQRSAHMDLTKLTDFEIP